MKEKTIKKILKETKSGYDLMSDKFSETRKYFWRGLEFIANYAKNGDKILDFGCGNGRLLELFKDKDIEYLGLDVSQKLIDKAREKYQNDKYIFQKISNSDSLSRSKIMLDYTTDIRNTQDDKEEDLVRDLALPENSFNAIFSVAVFHHLPSRNLRFKIAEELFRVLKPEGIIVITVWNLWQKKYIKNIFLNWKDKILGKSDLDWNDCYISFSDNGKKNKFQRFHHAFTKRELKKIFAKAGFKIEKCEIIDKRNVLLTAKK